MTTASPMPDDRTSPTSADHDDPAPASSMALSSLLSRRTLFRGGGALSLGLILAACGKTGGSSAPGRVGDAPPAATLPETDMAKPTNSALLRTLASLEYTVLDFYERSGELAGGDIKPEYAKAFGLFDRFVSDHQANADALNELARRAGSKPYECANPWFAERVIPPVDVAIAGGTNEDGGKIKPSDDPQRDVIIAAWALESLLGMSAQQLIVLPDLTDQSLRAEMIAIGLKNIRNAATLAIAATGSPDGYANPIVFSASAEEQEASTTAPTVPYALPSPFGLLSGVPITLGAEADGIRTAITLTTPAGNSYAYDFMNCKA